MTPTLLVCGHTGRLVVFVDRAWCSTCNDLYEIAEKPAEKAKEMAS